MADYQFLETQTAGGVLWVWLNRPDVRNAFNPVLIAELHDLFASLQPGGEVRAVALAGRGKAFCAGADLHWMREMAGYTEEDNLSDARRLAGMLQALDSCPVPVVARVQRAAFGGALGLLACCDTVICGDDATFAFSEVRLGISPATIAPYVVAKIGASAARNLLLSGETFDAQHALYLGLVHHVVSPEALDECVRIKLNELLKAAPLAAGETKALLRELTALADEAVRERTAALIARLRVAEEGQEGLSAFLSKRKPRWQEP